MRSSVGGGVVHSVMEGGCSPVSGVTVSNVLEVCMINFQQTDWVR